MRSDSTRCLSFGTGATVKESMDQNFINRGQVNWLGKIGLLHWQVGSIDALSGRCIIEAHALSLKRSNLNTSKLFKNLLGRQCLWWQISVSLPLYLASDCTLTWHKSGLNFKWTELNPAQYESPQKMGLPRSYYREGWA